MNRRYLAAPLAAAATIAILAAAPAPAAASTPATAAAQHPEGFLAWTNSLTSWGFKHSPDTGECYNLDPDIKEDAFVVNFTDNDADFYTGQDCEGEAAYTLSPYDTEASTDSEAQSVRFNENRSDNPGPLPEPMPSEPTDGDS